MTVIARESSSCHQALTGQTIRNGDRTYTVEETLAHGQFGSVFACRDAWGHSRILRQVRPFSRNYDPLRERWSADVAGLQRIQHPALVYLQDGFEADGVFHLVVERCDHRLDRYIVSPVWDGSRWFRAVARPVLCALEHLHRAGYIHQNLHPHNVFCTTHLESHHPDSIFSGAIKLGDADVNTLLGSLDVVNAKIPRWLVPPEYLNTSELGPMDHRVDIYQAGLLLLCILQGRIVRYSFEEISLGLPAKDAEKLDSSHGQAIVRALQLKVADRFQTAAELWRALDGSRPL
jgi:serine/threonine protein kinase